VCREVTHDDEGRRLARDGAVGGERAVHAVLAVKALHAVLAVHAVRAQRVRADAGQTPTRRPRARMADLRAARATEESG
jgi:hypothetical protein